MVTDPAHSNAVPSDDAAERGNSGEGKDPGEGRRRSGDDGGQRAASDATGSSQEKDARAFDHPGKSGPPG
jgi:hypothetical protein